MTIAEAQALLNKRLFFGNAEQIAAMNFLRAVSEARERVARCKQCLGVGNNRRGKLCPFCADGYPEDVLMAIGVADEETPVSEAD